MKTRLHIWLGCGIGIIILWLLVTEFLKIQNHVSDAQLIEDFPQQTITIDAQDVSLEVSFSLHSLKVRESTSQDDREQIYCDVVLLSDEYRLEGVYYCEYKYNGKKNLQWEKGWIEDADLYFIGDIPVQYKDERGNANSI